CMRAGMGILVLLGFHNWVVCSTEEKWIRFENDRILYLDPLVRIGILMSYA
ncbi:hypothetical protein Droror1_Dr00020470, partial [Drosera rotundifolia]